MSLNFLSNWTTKVPHNTLPQRLENHLYGFLCLALRFPVELIVLFFIYFFIFFLFVFSFLFSFLFFFSFLSFILFPSASSVSGTRWHCKNFLVESLLESHHCTTTDQRKALFVRM